MTSQRSIPKKGPAWTTPDEIAELIRRVKLLLKNVGVSKPSTPPGEVVTTVTDFFGVNIEHKKRDGQVYVEDQVAGVLVFDYKTEGVREVFGGTARNVLLVLRREMVLDDLAAIR